MSDESKASKGSKGRTGAKSVPKAAPAKSVVANNSSKPKECMHCKGMTREQQKMQHHLHTMPDHLAGLMDEISDPC